ncbi:MAG TPA: hypothetical protein PK096_03485 [Candidatus Saccharibacteria bacterium]|nr:hypothetical protein [Candidatus Saccharibacteria bacterium]HRK94406.1 hypothetical protein [Candidatus Saccharibacteria bacterium]
MSRTEDCKPCSLVAAGNWVSRGIGIVLVPDVGVDGTALAHQYLLVPAYHGMTLQMAGANLTDGSVKHEMIRRIPEVGAGATFSIVSGATLGFKHWCELVIVHAEGLDPAVSAALQTIGARDLSLATMSTH